MAHSIYQITLFENEFLMLLVYVSNSDKYIALWNIG